MGANGTMAGQYHVEIVGQWSVKRGQLYMSIPPVVPTLEPVQPFSVTFDPDGVPIMKVKGKVYLRCT